MFSGEFCKISHNTFFKEPFGELLLHKHSLCLLSYHDLSPFEKYVTHIFWLSIFFGLISSWEQKWPQYLKPLAISLFSAQSNI